jgi:cysteine desulfurase
MRKPIYFDFMATTPIDPKVIQKMLEYMGENFGNPASIQHKYGHDAAIAVEHARQQIATTIHANPEDLIFTSGATEANNLALLGAAKFYQRKGKHIITVKTEHRSVLDPCRQLEREGFEITYLTPDHNGILSPELLQQTLREDTILVSIMHVNNEIGVIQDLEKLSHILKNKGIIFHVDAAQSAGKVAIDVNKFNIDLMSLSAHKNYGPKGIGALYIRHKPRIRLQAQTFGGGQEQGLRSGTLATHQIVGMGEAFAIAEQSRICEQKRILELRQYLWNSISDLPGISLNGHPTQRIAGNLNFCLQGFEGHELIIALPDLAVSTMSACTASSLQPSYVLRALGLSTTAALSSIRLTIGRTTTLDEVNYAITCLRNLFLS